MFRLECTQLLISLLIYEVETHMIPQKIPLFHIHLVIYIGVMCYCLAYITIGVVFALTQRK